MLQTFGLFVYGWAFVLIRESDANKLRKVIGHGALLIGIAVQLLMWHFDLSSVLYGLPR